MLSPDRGGILSFIYPSFIHLLQYREQHSRLWGSAFNIFEIIWHLWVNFRYHLSISLLVQVSWLSVIKIWSYTQTTQNSLNSIISYLSIIVITWCRTTQIKGSRPSYDHRMKNLIQHWHNSDEMASNILKCCSFVNRFIWNGTWQMESGFLVFQTLILNYFIIESNCCHHVS